MLSRRHGLKVLFAACLSACGPRPQARALPAGEAPVRVFAAASLTDVLKRVGDAYAATGRPEPVFNFASSSDLARQIEQGAQCDVFISADEAWMDYLAEKSLIDPATRTGLLTNKLVLIAPADRAFSLEIKPGMDLKAAIEGGKLAIANPLSVPAGKYAKEALEHFGAWAGLVSQTALAESVRAALRFVETGEAAAGIVYATDAKASGDKVVVVGQFPDGSHTPIAYPAAATRGKAIGEARTFLAFLKGPKAGAAFESAGFGLQR